MPERKVAETSTDVREKNKRIVMDALRMVFNERNVQAAAAFLTDDYIQHNPMVPTGKAGFLKGIPELYRMFPVMRWEMKNIWADGDYVIVHSLYSFAEGARGQAVVDIFRLQGGKLAEHWDVMQEIPEKMAHDNGMF